MDTSKGKKGKNTKNYKIVTTGKKTQRKENMSWKDQVMEDLRTTCVKGEIEM